MISMDPQGRKKRGGMRGDAVKTPVYEGHLDPVLHVEFARLSVHAERSKDRLPINESAIAMQHKKSKTKSIDR